MIWLLVLAMALAVLTVCVVILRLVSPRWARYPLEQSSSHLPFDWDQEPR
jgi:hypothetical protein